MNLPFGLRRRSRVIAAYIGFVAKKSLPWQSAGLESRLPVRHPYLVTPRFCPLRTIVSAGPDAGSCFCAYRKRPLMPKRCWLASIQIGQRPNSLTNR